MINNIIIILMTLTLIINTYKLIYYYQNDNYHFRIFKIILFKDIKYKPYIFLYIIILFCKKNSIIKYLLLIFSLINICFEYRIKKIKNTNRIKRLFLIYFIFLFLLIYIIKNITSKINILLLLNSFYILITLLLTSFCFFIELILSQKYKKQMIKKINKYNPFIIGITGSCGKTSIKNYIYEILKDYQITIKSPKSYNTLNGLMITINNNLKSYNNILILEMGAAYKNDIKKIVKHIKPNISIISEILPQHLQTFKNINNITNEKMQIVQNTKQTIICNMDNDIIKNNIESYNIYNKEIITIGTNKNNKYYAKNIKIFKDKCEFELVDNEINKTFIINSKLIGRHNIYNLLITYACLRKLNINSLDIINKFELINNHESRLEVKCYNDLTILNDSYNSNINGFINALEILSLYDGKKCIITPGIVEAGKQIENINKKIAFKIAKTVDFCYLIDNKNTKFLVKEFNNLNFNNYCVKKSFNNAFNEIKNDTLTVLIENDLTDFYLL